MPREVRVRAHYAVRLVTVAMTENTKIFFQKMESSLTSQAGQFCVNNIKSGCGR